jgi:heme-degrading monooxygenase HmoA
MFVVYMTFPPIKQGKDAEFREWFAWSTKEYAKHKGFLKRTLLKAHGGTNYAAIMKHESFETFKAMHNSPTQAESHKRMVPLLEAHPSATFYEVVDLQ